MNDLFYYLTLSVETILQSLVQVSLRTRHKSVHACLVLLPDVFSVPFSAYITGSASLCCMVPSTKCIQISHCSLMQLLEGLLVGYLSVLRIPHAKEKLAFLHFFLRQPQQ